MADETDFKFDDRLRQQIHFDWGKYYKRLGKNGSARKQFVDSLSLKENAHGPMEQLSKCYLVRGDASNALDLANQCVKNCPKIARHKCHRNECIYDGNEFENCLVERYRMYDDKKPALGSLDAIKMTELTLEESIGNQTGSFLNKFRKAISELDKIEAETVDARPLWKVRRDKNECDVVSICSESNERKKESTTIDHPLHIYGVRKREKKNRSLYFSTPTIETFDFLSKLSNDQRLNFPPSEASSNSIKNAIEEELNVFKKFEDMLQQRQPIYAIKLLHSKNNKKFNKLAVLRTQETIEHRATNQLDRIKKLKDTDLFGLLTYAEDIITNFYLIKSVKVFPKKFEFLETIYNIIGTCYIDKISTNISTHCDYGSYSFRPDWTLSDHHGFLIPKKFNISPGFNDPTDHFIKRLRFAEIPIEKCYIYHQLSRLYFEREKFLESKEMADELINTSRSLNNYNWMLLGYLRILLVDDMLGDLENVKMNVEAIRKWKVNVKETIWNFLEKKLFQ